MWQTPEKGILAYENLWIQGALEDHRLQYSCLVAGRVQTTAHLASCSTQSIPFGSLIMQRASRSHYWWNPQSLQEPRTIQLGSSGEGHGVPCSLLLKYAEGVAGAGEGRLILDTGVAPEATPLVLGKEEGKKSLSIYHCCLPPLF